MSSWIINITKSEIIMLYSKLKDILKKNEKLHNFVLSNQLISRIRLEATPMGFFRNFIFFP